MTTRARAAARMIELLDGPLLKALAEPARLQIVRVLVATGPADVGTIALQLPQDRSVISRHLRVLEDAGVVVGTRVGRTHRYAIDGATLVGNLDRILGETRTLVAACCPPIEPVVPVARLTRRGRS